MYDRANWCPGAEVWTYDFELTPFTTAGTTVTLDHDVQSYTQIMVSGVIIKSKTK
ncbi:MAG: hypothetical protein IPG89_05950 [Bacteroidetes bacterium]|nr:hypothetical protein [Bacteroidota bacterium]